MVISSHFFSKKENTLEYVRNALRICNTNRTFSISLTYSVMFQCRLVKIGTNFPGNNPVIKLTLWEIRNYEVNREEIHQPKISICWTMATEKAVRWCSVKSPTGITDTTDSLSISCINGATFNIDVCVIRASVACRKHKLLGR